MVLPFGLPTLSDPAEVELISQMVKFPQVLERVFGRTKTSTMLRLICMGSPKISIVLRKSTDLAGRKDAKHEARD